jgi:hypothetical protein
MSQSSETQQDLELKLKMMRYLWHLGYNVRKNVGVQEIWQEETTRYTDIDVLGIKIDEELNAHFVLSDCKSGVTDKTRERLFWLSGVMKYFNVDRAYFLRAKMLSSRYAELADTLGISLISEDQFLSLEKSYDISTTPFGPFCSEHTKAAKILQILKEKDRRTYHYVETGYWRDPPQKQILSLISCCKMIGTLPEIKAFHRDFLLAYCLSALSVSILRFAQKALTIPSDQKNEFVKLSLMGGKVEYEDKKILVGSFYDFMTREIEQRYREKYPISSTQFRDSLLPEYSKYLVDLVNRICQKPTEYVASPRLLTLVAFESVLSSRKTKPEYFKPGLPCLDTAEAVAAANDFVIFAARSNLIGDDTSKLLREELSDVK